MGKGVRFDREVVTKGGRDDSFVRHRSIRTCHPWEGALVCNGEELRRDGDGGGGFKRTGLFEWISFLRECRFSNAPNLLVIGSLTTSSIRALSRWCNAFLQWFVMGEPFVLASRFAEISWRGRREELEDGNWRPAFLPKGVS